MEPAELFSFFQVNIFHFVLLESDCFVTSLMQTNVLCFFVYCCLTKTVENLNVKKIQKKHHMEKYSLRLKVKRFAFESKTLKRPGD